MINQLLKNAPRFTREEEAALASVKDTDAKAREQLILSVLPWCVKLAFRIRHLYHLIDDSDVISCASEGATMAVDRFDIQRGTRLTTYASFWVHGAFERRWREIRKEVAMETHEDGHVTMVRANTDSHDWRHRGRGFGAKWPVMWEGDDGAIQRERAMREEASLRARGALVRLPERELRIVYDRFWNDMTLQEIGDKLGISKERVRQIEKGALGKMRKALSNGEG